MPSEPTERKDAEHLDRPFSQVNIKPPSSKSLYVLTLQTPRAWVTEPYDDLMAYIRSKGLGNAVLEGVPLGQARSTENVCVPDGHPSDAVLVDFAVVEREVDRVVRDFVPITLPLKEVSFVNLAFDSELPERQILLRHYQIYRTYLQQFLERKAKGQVPALVLPWYDTRFIEIRYDIREAFESSREYLYSECKASRTSEELQFYPVPSPC